MTFKLPDLPYNISDLEPSIDARTMAIHHDKHHAAYVNNLNKALENYPELQQKDIADLLADLDAVPEEIRTAVRNNGGGDANHSFFWPGMSPKVVVNPPAVWARTSPARLVPLRTSKHSSPRLLWAALAVVGPGCVLMAPAS